MNYKLIDFNCEKPILKRGEPAFPKLDYSQNLPLNLNSSTLAAAYTTIHGQLGKEFFDDIIWVERNSDDWHNDMLARRERDSNPRRFWFWS